MTDDYQKEQSRQLEREAKHRAEGAARSAEKREKQIKRSGLSTTSAAHKMKEKALESVVEELKRFIDVEDAKPKGCDKKEWYPLLADTWTNIRGEDVPVMDLFEVADTALITCLDAVGHQWTYNAAIVYVGRAYKMTRFSCIMRRDQEGRRNLARLEKAAKERSSNLQSRIKYVEKTAAKRGFNFEDWDETKCRMIGSLLIDAVQLGSGIIEITKADKEIWDKKTKRRKTVDEKILSLTDEASVSLRIANETLDGLSSRFGPMTSPPIQYPTTIGPYLDVRTAFQVPMVKKVWNPEHQKAIDTAVASGQMDGPLRAINRIMVTPLTVNEWVLDAVKWVKEEKSGMELEKFPVLDELPVPERKNSASFNKLSKDEQIAYAQSIKEAKKSNLEARASLRVVGGSITDAEELVGMTFYLPHQFDKRGRIYHTSNFGHHNADWMRGLIVFDNKGAITKDNVQYLQLTLANAWGNGVDKESFTERQNWVQQNIEKIRRCGNDFKASFPFWAQADDPFQFLAACRDYYLWDKNGDGHETGLPIGLDATNSGYQHYAAASFNKTDGVKVNLTKSSPDLPPEDLYVACMLKAQQIIEDDINTDLPARIAADPKSEDAQDAKRSLTAAKQLQDFGGLTRKVCKRPVMTWGYSSRRYGFADQIRSDWMKDLTKKLYYGKLVHPVTGEKVTKHPFGADEGFYAAIYIAGVLQTAIERTVTSARDGQNFFQRCARACARENKHFKFTTPLGFPMEQFYRVPDERRQQRVYLTDKETRKVKKQAKAEVQEFTDRVKMPKSENAVSPNIIHAMDATHLMQTVLLLDDNDVTDIMVVHDCFATTIDNVETMSLCVRKAFRDLYTDYCLYTDVLKQTIEQLEDPDNADLPTVFDKGSDDGLLDLEEVLGSEYAFS